MARNETYTMHGPGAPVYLAIGQNVWGRGLSVAKAYNNMQDAGRSSEWYVVKFPHDVNPYVGDIGTINYFPQGLPLDFDANGHVVASHRKA